MSRGRCRDQSRRRCAERIGAAEVQQVLTCDQRDAERVRHILSNRRNVVEKSMMGGLVFMADGHMYCGLNRGALMIRVGTEAHERTLALGHVRPMEFGGRSPKGFVRVDREGWRTEKQLASWVQRSLDFVATLPQKGAAPKARRAKKVRGD